MATGACRITLRDWKIPGGIAGRPVCPSCSETMRAVDETDSDGGTWFRHIADTDCPLVDNGRQVLEYFCQERNLLECYNVLCRILQLQFLDPEEFYGICKGAHFMRIWSLSALDRQNLPYVLALAKDVTAYDTDGEGRKITTHTQRSVMHSDRMIHIWLLGNDGFPIWLSRREVALLDLEIEGQRSDIDWILEQPALVAELGRFCREKGFCGERDQAGAQLPSPGQSGG